VVTASAPRPVVTPAARNRAATGGPLSIRASTYGVRQLGGELPIGLDLVKWRERRADRGHRGRDELCTAVHDVAHSVWIDRPKGDRQLAVPEDGPDPGLGQAVERRVGVFAGVLDVREVLHGGDAGIQALQRAGKVADSNILGPVAATVVPEHVLQIPAQIDVDGDSAQRDLPQMPMRVDEPWQHDPVTRVDHLGVEVTQIRSDPGDPAVFDQYVGVAVHRHLGLGVDHQPTAEQQSFGHDDSPHWKALWKAITKET
jgi:hypothetical protein